MSGVGDKLGRYVLLKRLATGGMGEVFVAAKTGPVGFGPLTAIKVLRSELAVDQQFVDMLVDEANITMQLHHQNVVSVLDLGEDSGKYYIAMEYVQGITSERLIESIVAKNQKLRIPIALYIATELCRALEYAHTRRSKSGEPLNIIHRDVTPANILLSTQGEVKLTDFGIARAKGRIHQTQSGVLKGKFGYMAPESVRYEELDCRADIFCAGVVTYLLTAGHHPVANASVMEAIQRYEERRIVPPSSENPEISQQLDQVILKALDPQPNNRWRSASEFSNALRHVIYTTPAWRAVHENGAQHLSTTMRQIAPEVFEEIVPSATLARIASEPGVPTGKSDPAKPHKPPSWDGSLEDTKRKTTPLRDVTSSPQNTKEPSLSPSQSYPGNLVAPEKVWASDLVYENERDISGSLLQDEAKLNTPPSYHLTDINSRAQIRKITTEDFDNYEDTTKQLDPTREQPSNKLNPTENKNILTDTIKQPRMRIPQSNDQISSDLFDSFDNSSPFEYYTAVSEPVEETETHHPIIELNELAMAASTSKEQFTDDLADKTIAVINDDDEEHEEDTKTVVASEEDISDDMLDAETLAASAISEKNAFEWAIAPETVDHIGHQQALKHIRNDQDTTQSNLDVTNAPHLADVMSSNFNELSSDQRGLSIQEVVNANILDPGGSAINLKAVRINSRTTSPSASHQSFPNGSQPLSWPQHSRSNTTDNNDPTDESLPSTRDIYGNSTYNYTSKNPSTPGSGQYSGQSVHSTISIFKAWPNYQVPIFLVLISLFVLGVTIYAWTFTSAFWPKVNIETVPKGALVTIDGQIAPSLTPVIVSVDPNTSHQIELSLEGYKLNRQQTGPKIYKGNIYHLVIELEKEAPIIVVPVAATIYVNGKKMGFGQKVSLQNLPKSGQINIKIEATGYLPYEMTFDSSDKIPTSLDIPLETKTPDEIEDDF